MEDDKKKYDDDDDDDDHDNFKNNIDDDNIDMDNTKKVCISKSKKYEDDTQDAILTHKTIYNICKNMIKYVNDESLPLCDYLTVDSVMKFVESITE